VKVGDLVLYQWGYPKSNKPDRIGTVVDFPQAIHPKEFQKVKVMTQEGLLETWIMQFCKIVVEDD